MIYTTILHPVRKQLGITLNEYCIADVIYHLSHNGDNPSPGWCFASKQHIAQVLDISKRWVIKSIDSLERTGLIEKTDNGRLLRTTQKWFKMTVEGRETMFTDGEQSSPLQVNKVPSTGEQSSPPSYTKSYNKKDTIGDKPPKKSVIERRDEFYKSLTPFIGKYGKEMLRKFFDYWSEIDDDHPTKMKWEIARSRKGTWSLSGRLSYWKNNPINSKTKADELPMETVTMPQAYRPA